MGSTFSSSWVDSATDDSNVALFEAGTNVEHPAESEVFTRYTLQYNHFGFLVHLFCVVFVDMELMVFSQPLKTFA